MELPAPRLMVGVRDRRHVAAFAVEESLDRVQERLTLVRGAIEARLTVSAIAECTYDDPAPRFAPETFMARAEELLARAVAERVPGAVGFLAVDARRR